MKLHPLLDDPRAVLISRTLVSEPVGADDYRQAAHQILRAMQVELEGEKAVLKPNVTSGEHFADPESGIATHPAFVQGLIEHLQAHGARRRGSYILEDPRNTNDNEPRHWRGTGYPEVAQATGAKLRTPKTYSCVKKAVPDPLVFCALNVSRLATGPNTVLVNVPKLKTHNLGITTLCMKNLMGTVNVYDRHYCSQAWREMPEEVRSDPRPRQEWFDRTLHEQYQAGLARRLADTAKVVPSHLCIVEGIVGREGTGFRQGRNRALGLAIGGINSVAVDSVASYLMGFPPEQLVYLNVAEQAGLGTNRMGDLRVYEVQAGKVVPCQDLIAQRADPPFQVISNIKGEFHTL
jgi:uncharacterized protein (DUF362 family)